MTMSDLQQYIEKRKEHDPTFANGFELGYADFKIGVLLRQAREASGLTQEQVALQIGTQKSAISRIENHAENITLATLKAYAQAVGYALQIQLVTH
jgi:HTH-type transcriptional regulator / antitoxin HipB